MRELELRFCLSLALTVVGAWGCSWAEVPRDAIFACDFDGCPEGLECRKGFCVARLPPDSGNPSVDACTPISCQQAGATCGPISSGCGKVLQCGSCPAPQSCGGGPDGGTPNTCGCTPLATTVACQLAGRNCGTPMLPNGCGQTVAVICGPACPLDGGWCLQESGAELCAKATYACGTLGVTDRCGVKRLVECGGCGDGGACLLEEPNDGGREARCGPCTPDDEATLCNRHGANCGELQVRDNCGVTRSLSCGTGCDDGGTAAQTCGVPMANQCSCQPVLAGCLVTAQCCPGTSCGPAGLCCVAAGKACLDDSECCGTLSCAAAGSDGGAFCQ